MQPNVRALALQLLPSELMITSAQPRVSQRPIPPRTPHEHLYFLSAVPVGSRTGSTDLAHNVVTPRPASAQERAHVSKHAPVATGHQKQAEVRHTCCWEGRCQATGSRERQERYLKAPKAAKPTEEHRRVVCTREYDWSKSKTHANTCWQACTPRGTHASAVYHNHRGAPRRGAAMSSSRARLAWRVWHVVCAVTKTLPRYVRNRPMLALVGQFEPREAAHERLRRTDFVRPAGSPSSALATHAPTIAIILFLGHENRGLLLSARRCGNGLARALSVLPSLSFCPFCLFRAAARSPSCMRPDRVDSILAWQKLSSGSKQ